MIYPEFFPIDRKNEFAENKVFDQLKRLSEKYDIFYSRKFITDGIGKKPEYEIDFIIAIPEKAIICLEVKALQRWWWWKFSLCLCLIKVSQGSKTST